MTAVARAAAARAGRCGVVVATDDAQIADHARDLGVDVALTAADLDSGSARAFAAACLREQAPEFIVNLQVTRRSSRPMWWRA